LSELPDAHGIGTDISRDALQTAHGNALHLGLADRATFIACDYAAALSGRFDLIVSNPPYIRSADIADLATEVCDHDPHRALDGGADGLDAYRALVPQATRLLASYGVLAMEVGQGQSADVERLMVTEGLTLERPPKADLAGIQRAVAGRSLPR
jgi:release factor glutamine methyltransferase